MSEQEYYMTEALIEAKKAFERNEVPIGAVMVRQGEIIARGYNLRNNRRRLASGRLYALCYSRALSYVCRSDCAVKNTKSSFWYKK